MRKIFLMALAMILLLSGCSGDKQEDLPESSGKLKVYTSIYPINFIASEIGGNLISVENVVPLGTDPHDYEPSMKTIVDMGKADLFIYNGAGLESWGEKVAAELDTERVLEASSTVELLDMEGNHEEEQHQEDEHEEELDHGDKDPHIWLSLKNMETIANEVQKRLSSLDPENSAQYAENYEALSEKLSELDNRYREELENRTSNTILVSHSAFGYLAKDYGIEQLSVTGVSPNAEPSPRTLSNLLDIAREKNLKYIYFETLASPKSVEMLSKEANLEPTILNPIGGLTEENIEKGDDYLTLMEENLENLKKELLK